MVIIPDICLAYSLAAESFPTSFTVRYLSWLFPVFCLACFVLNLREPHPLLHHLMIIDEGHYTVREVSVSLLTEAV